jgi:putative ABC transport system permease protein
MKYIFKSIIRNFKRRPVTNLINLLGLAVSLSLVFILSVYCYSELTTDNFHKNAERIYLYGELNNRINTPAILKDQIDLNITDIESVVRIGCTWENPVFQVENKDPFVSELIFADEDFFKLFTYNVVEGNLETCLKMPMTVAISKTLAKKLFGNGLAIGKEFRMNNSKNLTVSAVFDDPEANSCLTVKAVTSIATRGIVQPNADELTNWGYGNFQTFILLKSGVNPDHVVKSIFSLIPQNRQKEYTDTKLVPFKKLYFSKFAIWGNNYLHCGDKNKVMVLLLVAVLVLIIALINFINISSTQWIEKIRQTGILKVIGAKRSSILRNSLVEAIVFFLAALFLSILLVFKINPVIQAYTGIHFNPGFFHSPYFILAAIVCTVLLSLLFSFIPAFRISSSRALDNIKKSINPGTSGSLFRNMLVTIQFVIAMVLIAFTILIQKQIHFGSTNLGFYTDNIIGIKLTDQLSTKRDVLKEMLGEIPAVKKISFAQYYPGKPISSWGMQVDFQGEKEQLEFNTFCADAKFFDIMHLKTISGRLYSENLPTDNEKVVVNKTFVKKYNINNPLGGKLFSWNH